MNFVRLISLIPLLLASTVHGREIGTANIASLSTQLQWPGGQPSIRFSWQIESEGRGQQQRSYRILLSKDAKTLIPEGELVWDSKKVESGESLFVTYTGPELERETTYYWKVQLSNVNDELGSWSESASLVVPKNKQNKKLKPAENSKSIGDFQCSELTLNELFKTSVANRKKNLTAPPSFVPKEVPASAPLQLTARGYSFQASLADYYTPWVEKLVAATNEDKTFPTQGGNPKYEKPSPGYSDAAVVIPFVLWQLDGNIAIVEEIFPSAVDYVGALQQNDPDFSGKAFGNAIGDFGNTEDPTSPEFLSLCFFALDCRILAKVATEISHLPYMIQHQAWFNNLRKGFEKSFLDEDKILTEKSQTAQILALRFGLLPPEVKQPTADKLAARLEQEGLKAGIFGTSAVLPVLSWTGHHEQAVALVKSYKETRPEISEVALASASEWMMSFLAGFIHEAPGFKTSRISPFVPQDGSVTEVKAHHDTPYGRLAIHWKTTEEGSHSGGNHPAKHNRGGLPARARESSRHRKRQNTRRSDWLSIHAGPERAQGNHRPIRNLPIRG